MEVNLLSLLLVVYGTLCFGVRSFLLWKRTGHTGVVLSNGDSAHDFIGKAFGLILVMCCLYVILIYFSIDSVENVAPAFFQNKSLARAGLLLISIATVVCFRAQMNMSNSWRVGIDFENAGKLVPSGLFKFSRNPIFFTMLAALSGVFLVLPNWISFVIFLVSYLLIQIQVRLEEEFLKEKYGSQYSEYAKRTGRWF